MATWREALEELHRIEQTIRLGGGTAASERQHKKNRLTARERLAQLIDPHAPSLELGLWAAHGMYEAWGGAPLE